ncbi:MULTISPECIES: class I SAM-dependent methyltransferase [unclassified Okeania]|uniref:class I SAM-dependent methyltransferase n=1 Tax=unclassified Okeania TaxID=2634635 RepID=UPI0013BAACB1|nr:MULTISPECIES: class I SAM-dependent methyltransferase [unclassified Okeania]NES77623.1 class I SAM-dependent methyltransferase [Okeania sp. SIO1H4]NET13689.1 class I SAM-dependent methyltransferase [Okeania sp. SIO1H6]NET21251.1 class I SAM-dependent methyltransferase [Okeania sp. SIO1H5]NET92672.1 class I SAM-dependent methyltransferase [Okeania sp. SIO1H2]
MLLQANQRTKLDDSDDRLFYSYPRFVTHVDEGFIDQLTNLYRDRLKPHTRILDMMSSWVSHLPQDMEFAHVEGHGMNEEELAKNRQLNHYFVQDLNKDLKLPFPDQDFDAVVNCVSIQYLQYPDAIFYEIYRILKPGGIAIISFSNRMFYQKAISAWRDGSETSRVELVKRYFDSVKSANEIPGFSQVEVIYQKSNVPSFLQMFGLGGGDPFYAVIAYRQV